MVVEEHLTDMEQIIYIKDFIEDARRKDIITDEEYHIIMRKLIDKLKEVVR